MKKFTLLTLFLIQGALISCSSVNNQAYITPFSSQVTSPLEADIDVDTSKKIKGTARKVYLFGFLPLGSHDHLAEGLSTTPVNTLDVNNVSNPFKTLTGKAKAKAAALYRAVEKNDADLLVAPAYRYKTRGFLLFNVYTVEVSGYKGTIKSIKKAEKKD